MAHVNIEARDRLSEIVKKARGSRSQREFGKLLGVTYATIQAWENGDYMPESANLSRIAASAGYTLQELLDYLDGKPLDKKPVEKIIEQVDLMPVEAVAKIAHAALTRLTKVAEGK